MQRSPQSRAGSLPLGFSWNSPLGWMTACAFCMIAGARLPSIKDYERSGASTIDAVNLAEQAESIALAMLEEYPNQ